MNEILAGSYIHFNGEADDSGFQYEAIVKRTSYWVQGHHVVEAMMLGIIEDCVIPVENVVKVVPPDKWFIQILP